MVKQTVTAHEQVNEYVNNLKSVSAVGLILGHVSAKQHFIVQLVRTPEPEKSDLQSPNAKRAGKSVDSTDVAGGPLVNEQRFMQHARSVNRMLPGGLLITGVFLFAAENELEKEYNAARNLLSAIHTQLYAKHVTDAGLEPDGIPVHEMTILTISKTTKRFTCKLYDARDTKSVGRLVDVRFESLANKWIRLNTILNVDLPLCTSRSANEYGDLLLTNWKRVRELFVAEMWHERCEMLVADRLLLAHADRDALASARLADVLRVRRGRKDVHEVRADADAEAQANEAASSQFNVEVLTRLRAAEAGAELEKVEKCQSRATKVHLRGAIDSCAFLHDGATLLDTLFAVKFDIVRSFLSRGDLLMDEMQIAEREVLPSTIEQRLPIRIYIDNLLCRPLIYADFIFVHETYEDVLDRVRYYLDVSGNQPPARLTGGDAQAKANAADSASSSMSGSPTHSLTNLVSLATSSLRHADASFVISATQPHIHFDIETPVESSETDVEPERSVSDAPGGAQPDDPAPNQRASFDIDSLDDTPQFLDDTELATSERRVEPQSTSTNVLDSHSAQPLSASSSSRDTGATSRSATSSSTRLLFVLSALFALLAIAVACYFVSFN